MKKSGILIASVTAASATAISSSKVRISRHQDDSSKKKDGNSSKSVSAPASSDKFAPKFDGLRFIETLVTAHR
ncbi:PREDICTED: uncharacterized protein LOC109241340 [Nicotiana attenuata]|uniref:uncharacterized protein LOC109241340 n=1 Tax=Nicotiana attenuata TaxID=49451 RepID=UPI00090583CB|nr:PREDICTED: uncharacterized protein LOC109241340 [Nicotiana attenuata]